MKRKKKLDETVYQRIANKRNERGLTQMEIARQMGIDQGAYSLLEKGHSILTVGKLIRIAEILHVSPAYFIDPNYISLQTQALQLLADLGRINRENNIKINFPKHDITRKQFQAIIKDKTELISTQRKEIAAYNQIIDSQKKNLDQLNIICSEILQTNLKSSLKAKLRLIMSEQS
jgi:transcriptional regulator with XRE-family HTH domain